MRQIILTAAILFGLTSVGICQGARGPSDSNRKPIEINFDEIYPIDKSKSEKGTYIYIFRIDSGIDKLDGHEKVTFLTEIDVDSSDYFSPTNVVLLHDGATDDRKLLGKTESRYTEMMMKMITDMEVEDVFEYIKGVLFEFEVTPTNEYILSIGDQIPHNPVLRNVKIIYE